MSLPPGWSIDVDWGDGKPQDHGVTGHGPVVLHHIYPRWGCYEVRLKFVDEQGVQRAVHEASCLVVPEGVAPGRYTDDDRGRWRRSAKGRLELTVA